MSAVISEILEFWFGPLDGSGLAGEAMHDLWFQKNDQTDREMSTRFATRVEQAVNGELLAWSRTDSGLMASILLLDQFTRNIYRGTKQAFAGDCRALGLAVDSIRSGRHRNLPAIHQAFLFMPLEHSENLEQQDQCIALFSELAAATGHAQIESFLRYASAHRDVIMRFGRFPHRNTVLGRESTPDELAYLKQHGGF